MSTYTVTLQIPAATYRQLRALARRKRRTAEAQALLLLAAALRSEATRSGDRESA